MSTGLAPVTTLYTGGAPSAPPIDVVNVPYELIEYIMALPEQELYQLAVMWSHMGRSGVIEPDDQRLLKALSSVSVDAKEVEKTMMRTPNVFYSHAHGVAITDDVPVPDADVPTAAQAVYDHPRVHESKENVAQIFKAAQGIPYTVVTETEGRYDVKQVPIQDILAVRRDLDKMECEPGQRPSGIITFNKDGPVFLETSEVARASPKTALHIAIENGTEMTLSPDEVPKVATDAIYKFSDHAYNAADCGARTAAKHVAHVMAQPGLKQHVDTETYAASLEGDAFRQAAAAIREHGDKIPKEAVQLVATAANVRAGAYDDPVPGLAKKARQVIKGKATADDVIAHLATVPAPVLLATAVAARSMLFDAAPEVATNVLSTMAAAPNAWKEIAAKYKSGAKEMMQAHRDLAATSVAALDAVPKKTTQNFSGRAYVNGEPGTIVATAWKPRVPTTLDDGRTVGTNAHLVHGVFFADNGISKSPTHFHTDGFTTAVNGAEVARVKTFSQRDGARVEGTGLIALKPSDAKLHMTLASN